MPNTQGLGRSEATLNFVCPGCRASVGEKIFSNFRSMSGVLDKSTMPRYNGEYVLHPWKPMDFAMYKRMKDDAGFPLLGFEIGMGNG